MSFSAGGDKSHDEYSLAAEFYDGVVPYRERQDVVFFVEMARAAVGPVLELGCGTGRVLIPTAKAGCRIAGLDASSSMLAVCRQKLSAEPEEVQGRVTLTRGDMRRFDLRREFDLITLPFRPFQHLLSVGDQLSCLTSIHRHLAPGGRLVLDIFNPSIPHLAALEGTPLPPDNEPEFTLPDGRRVLRRVRVTGRDLFSQIQEIELKYLVTHPDAREELFSHRIRMRYLFRHEAEHLLARCGFEVEDVFADYDRTPYGAKYPGELIFVATRA